MAEEKTEKEKKEIEKDSPYEFRGDNGNYEAKSVDDFLSFIQQKGYGYEMTPDAFLNFEHEKITNYSRIIEQYTPEEKEEYKDDIAKNYPPIIKVGTTVFFPNDKITVEIQKILGSDLFLEQQKFKVFWSEVQEKLLTDPKYVPFNTIEKTIQGNISGVQECFNVQTKALNIKVWVYVRALQKMYNISQYIRNCTTNKDKTMGQFSFEVTPIENLENDTYSNDFLTHFSILDKDRQVRNNWFTKFIQNNDVVFIRYEVLQIELGVSGVDVDDYSSRGTGEVPVSELGGSTKNNFKTMAQEKVPLVWDMIGLVDNVNLNVNVEANDYTVQINGRDFTKLIVEDGSYFIPLKFVEGSPDRWFYGGDPESSWFKRNMITGAFDYYFTYSFQGINQVLWFIINQLSNIGIVGDELFQSCAKTTEKMPIETDDEKYKQDNKVKGVWQIVRTFIDEALNDRRIVDRSLINPEGTLLDLFGKVCQEPFVEFWGDTWIDEFDFIVRQPPFTESAITDVVDSQTYIEVSSNDTLSFSLSYDDRAYTWYRIMPQNSLMGSSQFSSLAFVPIIFFNEYCELYGNKRCIVNDIYLSEKSFRGKDSGKDLNNLSQALLNDLLFVVETNAYLPFTRRGTITINGDRRIKIGTFIHFKPTNELFYVTAVNNTISFENNSVDRTTTLTVERGMFMDLIKKNSEGMSYFNIINIEGIRQEIIKRNQEIQNEQEVSPSQTNFGVNSAVFEYFANRQNFQTDDVNI